MRNIQFNWLLALVFLLSACATVPTPQSLLQRIKLAEATLTGVVDSAANMIEMEQITKAEGRAILAVARQADDALVLANVAVKVGDADTATKQLLIAQRILIQLQARVKPDKTSLNFYREGVMA